jgi:15,16-dihydrobiliverdin:ferredoxin oxidoreductase
MLFARFESESFAQDELIHAIQKYVQMHVQLVKDCPEKNSIQNRLASLERHVAYDTYSAERDPAVGLFVTMFGKEWANDFIIHKSMYACTIQIRMVQAYVDSCMTSICMYH